MRLSRPTITVFLILNYIINGLTREKTHILQGAHSGKMSSFFFSQLEKLENGTYYSYRVGELVSTTRFEGQNGLFK